MNYLNSIPHPSCNSTPTCHSSDSSSPAETSHLEYDEDAPSRASGPSTSTPSPTSSPSSSTNSPTPGPSNSTGQSSGNPAGGGDDVGGAPESQQLTYDESAPKRSTIPSDPGPSNSDDSSSSSGGSPSAGAPSVPVSGNQQAPQTQPASNPQAEDSAVALEKSNKSTTPKPSKANQSANKTSQPGLTAKSQPAVKKLAAAIPPKGHLSTVPSQRPPLKPAPQIAKPASQTAMHPLSPAGRPASPANQHPGGSSLPKQGSHPGSLSRNATAPVPIHGMLPRKPQAGSAPSQNPATKPAPLLAKPAHPTATHPSFPVGRPASRANQRPSGSFLSTHGSPPGSLGGNATAPGRSHGTQPSMPLAGSAGSPRTRPMSTPNVGKPANQTASHPLSAAGRPASPANQRPGGSFLASQGSHPGNIGRTKSSVAQPHTTPTARPLPVSSNRQVAARQYPNTVRQQAPRVQPRPKQAAPVKHSHLVHHRHSSRRH